MLLTITLIISSLLAVNLLLLKFSSNKIERSTKQNRKPAVYKPETPVKSISTSTRLAPTGS